MGGRKKEKKDEEMRRWGDREKKKGRCDVA
jgi:hypothetical protein